MTQKYWPAYRINDTHEIVDPEDKGWKHPFCTPNSMDQTGHTLDNARYWLKIEIERDAWRKEAHVLKTAVATATAPTIDPGHVITVGIYDYVILEKKP